MPRKSKPWWWSSRKCWATTIDGKRVTAPPEVETEHEAWEWHRALLDGMSQSKPIQKSSLTVRHLFEAYAQWDDEGAEAGVRNRPTTTATLSCIQVALRTMVGHSKFGALKAARLVPAHYDALIAAWRRAGYKPSYVATLAQVVKTVLRWASRPSVDRPPMIDASPFGDCAKPSRTATGEKVGDRRTAAAWLWFLWKTCDHPGHRDDATFQRCLIHTGVRPSELAWATWGEVNWDAAADAVGNPMAIVARREWKNAKKSGKVRRIFIPARLVRSLRRRAEGRGAGDLIYPRPGGSRHTSPSLSGRTYWLRAKAVGAGVAMVDGGGRPMTNYLWRHTAASTLLMNGVDAATVAELLGTSVQEIQRTYGHLLDDHLAAATAKLGRRRPS